MRTVFELMEQSQIFYNIESIFSSIIQIKKNEIKPLELKMLKKNLATLTSRKALVLTQQNSSSLHSMTSPQELLVLQ